VTYEYRSGVYAMKEYPDGVEGDVRERVDDVETWKNYKYKR